MLTTLGSDTSFNPAHPLNADFPTAVTFSKLISVKTSLPLNADSPMLVTLSAKVIVCNFVHAAKAELPIAVIPSSTTTVCMSARSLLHGAGAAIL